MKIAILLLILKGFLKFTSTMNSNHPGKSSRFSGNPRVINIPRASHVFVETVNHVIYQGSFILARIEKNPAVLESSDRMNDVVLNGGAGRQVLITNYSNTFRNNVAVLRPHCYVKIKNGPILDANLVSYDYSYSSEVQNHVVVRIRSGDDEHYEWYIGALHFTVNIPEWLPVLESLANRRGRGIMNSNHPGESSRVSGDPQVLNIPRASHVFVAVHHIIYQGSLVFARIERNPAVLESSDRMYDVVLNGGPEREVLIAKYTTVYQNDVPHPGPHCYVKMKNGPVLEANLMPYDYSYPLQIQNYVVVKIPSDYVNHYDFYIGTLHLTENIPVWLPHLVSLSARRAED